MQTGELKWMLRSACRTLESELLSGSGAALGSSSPWALVLFSLLLPLFASNHHRPLLYLLSPFIPRAEGEGPSRASCSQLSIVRPTSCFIRSPNKSHHPHPPPEFSRVRRFFQAVTSRSPQTGCLCGIASLQSGLSPLGLSVRVRSVV